MKILLDLHENDRKQRLDEVYQNKKPDMWKLIKIVIPKIQAEWEAFAYSMQYDVATVETFKKDYHDSSICCKEFFKNWLSS